MSSATQMCNFRRQPKAVWTRHGHACSRPIWAHLAGPTPCPLAPVPTTRVAIVLWQAGIKQSNSHIRTIVPIWALDWTLGALVFSLLRPRWPRSEKTNWTKLEQIYKLLWGRCCRTLARVLSEIYIESCCWPLPMAPRLPGALIEMNSACFIIVLALFISRSLPSRCATVSKLVALACVRPRYAPVIIWPPPKAECSEAPSFSFSFSLSLSILLYSFLAFLPMSSGLSVSVWIKLKQSKTQQNAAQRNATKSSSARATIQNATTSLLIAHLHGQRVHSNWPPPACN